MPKTTPLLKIETMKKDKTLTAVEWLVEQLCIEHRVSLFEKAKEMERQQIIHVAKYYFHENGNITPEEIYNKTFGK